MEFTIQNIAKFDTETNMFGATVDFNLPDDADGTQVFQGVSVDLRIRIPDDATFAQIEETLLKKALEQLRAVLSKSEGRTALELRFLSEEFSKSFAPDDAG